MDMISDDFTGNRLMIALHLVTDLCGLAQQLIECVVLINLAMESHSVGMAVHPFGMQSPDPSKKADGMMLAKVTQALHA